MNLQALAEDVRLLTRRLDPETYEGLLARRIARRVLDALSASHSTAAELVQAGVPCPLALELADKWKGQDEQLVGLA